MGQLKRSTPIELLAHRILSGSRPGKRTESPKRKLALIAQGGAMRGSVSGSMVYALQEIMGDNQPFDVMYGVSSGAWSVAFLQTRQTCLGAFFYYIYLAKNFVRPINFFLGKFTGKPVVNIDYFLEGARNKVKLDIDKIIHSQVPLKIYATNVDTGNWEEFDKYQTKEEVLAALHATVRVPYLSGKPFEWKGKRYYDGGVSVGRVPIWKAIEDGCTDIIVLWTEEDKDADYNFPFLERLMRLRLKRQYPIFTKQYWQGHEIHKKTIELINSGDLRIRVIRIKNEKLLPTPWETRPEKIYQATKSAYEAVIDALKEFPQLTQGKQFKTMSQFKSLYANLLIDNK